MTDENKATLAVLYRLKRRLGKERARRERWAVEWNLTGNVGAARERDREVAALLMAISCIDAEIRKLKEGNKS